MNSETVKNNSMEITCDTVTVKGVVRLVQWRGPYMVLPELWPSGSFAMKAFNSKNLVTYCKFSSGKGRNVFLATTLGKTLVTILRIDKFFPETHMQ